MKISYAITVCDEYVEIQRLIEFLLRHKRREDEIIVLFDISKQCTAVEDYLRSHSVNSEFAWHAAEFQGHFADWKNTLTSHCSGDYIFQIDADELPHEKLMEILPALLEENIECDVITVPRVNTVKGLTQEHVQKWGWNVDENDWVNWPDYQWRIYKNNPNIRWINRVHERIEGHSVWTHLPMMEEFALYHPKTIERQTKQNNYYETL
jgi:glycosyltransferase involved in cell wall biosynthesis